ncbi:hypothetical protein HDU92_009075 [Lobulomyces angularis]|nr:hypothetical protein HDU92_009075 [Lobulomyces angularis]
MQQKLADESKLEFRSHVTNFTYEPISTYEIKILSIINQIIEKPLWYQKINDEEIRLKWSKELRGFNDKIVDFALRELLYKANDDFFVRKLPDGACITCGPVEETFISENLINDKLLEELKKCVSVLENVPESEKDWHPFSNNLVLDLVHPSLYCIKSGNSISKDGKTIKLAADSNDVFQWIPSDVFVDADYSAILLSPINNLHPEVHKNTTEVIMKIFSKFVPLFENMLNIILIGPPASRIKLPYKLWNEFDQYEDESSDDSDAMWEYYERLENYRNTTPLLDPELDELTPYVIKTPYTLANKHLQVIVKLANVQLTPEKPKYDGGVWHCEGTQHENIVSTGIYYYDNKNITKSLLSFRVGVYEPSYKQDDHRGMELGYGLYNEELLIQPRGSIISKENRSIVFPNTMQHFVEPFELQDKTIPGHRKILAFFLIDPTKKIHSTGDVAPQQFSWTLKMLTKALKNKLPLEVIFKIVKLVDGLISLETAKEWRLELMEARKATDKRYYGSDGPAFLREFLLSEY